MAYRLGVCICDFGKPDCITGVSSELIVRLYLLCAYLVVVPTAVHLPLEGLVVCIIYYLLLIYLLPSGAARRHLYCLSPRTGRLFDRQCLSLYTIAPRLYCFELILAELLF